MYMEILLTSCKKFLYVEIVLRKKDFLRTTLECVVKKLHRKQTKLHSVKINSSILFLLRKELDRRFIVSATQRHLYNYMPIIVFYEKIIIS